LDQLRGEINGGMRADYRLPRFRNHSGFLLTVRKARFGS